VIFGFLENQENKKLGLNCVGFGFWRDLGIKKNPVSLGGRVLYGFFDLVGGLLSEGCKDALGVIPKAFGARLDSSFFLGEDEVEPGFRGGRHT